MTLRVLLAASLLWASLPAQVCAALCASADTGHAQHSVMRASVVSEHAQYSDTRASVAREHAPHSDTRASVASEHAQHSPTATMHAQHSGVRATAPPPCHATAPQPAGARAPASHDCADCDASLVLARSGASQWAASLAHADAPLAWRGTLASALAPAHAPRDGARPFARARHIPGAFNNLPLRL